MVTEVNYQGKGEVVRRAFSDIDADVYIMVDADMQYDISEIKKHIEYFLDKKLDMLNISRKVIDEDVHRKGHTFGNAMLTGFANFIFNLYKDNPHTCIIFTLEGQGTNRRKEFYPQYKANRKEVPQDLLLQLPIAITWLEAMRLPTLSLEGYEADDCIATLATLAKNQGFLVEIISHDKDLYQLIDDSIYIFDYAKRQKITARECKEKFGVTPDEFITYQSIVGDTSDNIPGIKGIGAKGSGRQSHGQGETRMKRKI